MTSTSGRRVGLFNNVVPGSVVAPLLSQGGNTWVFVDCFPNMAEKGRDIPELLVRNQPCWLTVCFFVFHEGLGTHCLLVLSKYRDTLLTKASDCIWVLTLHYKNNFQVFKSPRLNTLDASRSTAWVIKMKQKEGMLLDVCRFLSRTSQERRQTDHPLVP